jgi:predicted DNA-binding transcriptional regulator AlpA
MSDRLLDAKMASQTLGIARQTLAKWRLKGIGPSWRKFGSKVLYSEADLAEWIAAQPRFRSTAEVTQNCRSRRAS